MSEYNAAQYNCYKLYKLEFNFGALWQDIIGRLLKLWYLVITLVVGIYTVMIFLATMVGLLMFKTFANVLSMGMTILSSYMSTYNPIYISQCQAVEHVVVSRPNDYSQNLWSGWGRRRAYIVRKTRNMRYTNKLTKKTIPPYLLHLYSNRLVTTGCCNNFVREYSTYTNTTGRKEQWVYFSLPW